MAEPMRIRAQAAGEKTTVRVLMSHEMETGQRKDAAGKVIPAWYIQEVSAQLNGKTVMSAQWGPAALHDELQVRVLRHGRAGDKLSVSWADNKGDKRTDEAVVS
jgi:sulfur-oxidizing protein SoxZ